MPDQPPPRIIRESVSYIAWAFVAAVVFVIGAAIGVWLAS